MRVVAIHVGIGSDMPRTSCSKRQQVGAKRAFVGGAIGPKGAPRLPIRSQAFVMRHSILDDESFDAVRMGQGHAKAHGAAVVLHVQRVTREAKSLGEMLCYGCDFVEGVREVFRVRPVAVSE